MYYLTKEDTVEYNKSLMNLLVETNNFYNKFQYFSDMILFNELDHWTAKIEQYEAGDCDDYALSKRKKLIEEGVPYQCLFPTICTVYGEGHLVLVVRTSKNDLLLDSIEQKVVPINKVNYRWCYRLDPVNKRWLKLF